MASVSGALFFSRCALQTYVGNWLSSRWAQDQQPDLSHRLNQTIGDKLSNQLSDFLWPKIRIVFYVLAGIEMTLLLVSLFAPRT